MSRDAWYAGIAAAGLCAAAALYGLVTAPNLANPDVGASQSKLTASLPSPPGSVVTADIVAKAQAILSERNPFSKRSDADSSARMGLELPSLGPPIRFSDPDNEATVTTVAPATPPSALQPQAAIPQAPVPPATSGASTQGSLTLRGVFPTPSGGRAIVAMPDGQLVSVGVGGMVGGWRVLQIQQGAIRLGRGQRAILLAMPR